MNDESRYDVIFRGEILYGVTSGKVKENLTRLFKSPESTIEKLFSGKTIIIKKAITEQKAHTYQQAMQKAGAIAKVRLVEAIETVDEITKIKKQAELVDDDLPPPPAFTTEIKSENILNKPPSMNDNNYDEFSAPPPAEITNAADPLGIAPADKWHMEDVGTRMSKPKRPFNKPLPVTEHIELSPEKSNVGQAKHVVKTVNPDISHLGMAETGTLLSEMSNTTKPKVPDVSHINMADLGEDMGQLKKEKERVDPDISHLDLADN